VTAVNALVGDQVKAGDVLVTLDTTILEAKVREAEANLAAAEAQVRFQKRNKIDAVHLETAEAEVDRAQALVDLAKATLAAQSALTAPFDGIIVSAEIAPSETVTPGQTVIVLADFSSFQIETTDLSELDVTRVQVGQPVVIFIEALGEELSGEVAEVSLTSSTLGGEVVYAVTIAFDAQPEGLLWGMSADVQIQTGG
jgi:HlyD family secretion protein